MGLATRDPENVAAAVLDIEAILSAYLESSQRDADGTIMAILQRLDRDDVPTAAELIGKGLGQFRVIK